MKKLGSQLTPEIEIEIEGELIVPVKSLAMMLMA